MKKSAILPVLPAQIQQKINSYISETQLNPNDFNSWTSLGIVYKIFIVTLVFLIQQFSQVYHNAKLYSTAIEKFDKAILIEPNHTVAYQLKGLSLLESYRFKEAIPVLKVPQPSEYIKQCHEFQFYRYTGQWFYP